VLWDGRFKQAIKDRSNESHNCLRCPLCPIKPDSKQTPVSYDQWQQHPTQVTGWEDPMPPAGREPAQQPEEPRLGTTTAARYAAWLQFDTTMAAVDRPIG